MRGRYVRSQTKSRGCTECAGTVGFQVKSEGVVLRRVAMCLISAGLVVVSLGAAPTPALSDTACFQAKVAATPTRVMPFGTETITTSVTNCGALPRTVRIRVRAIGPVDQPTGHARFAKWFITSVPAGETHQDVWVIDIGFSSTMFGPYKVQARAFSPQKVASARTRFLVVPSA